MKNHIPFSKTLSLFSRLFLFLFISSSFRVNAQSLCSSLLSDSSLRISSKKSPELLTLENLGLEEPEIEAKFVIPSREILKAMKGLVGEKIVLFNENGERIKYHIEFNKEHIYEDTYYDTTSTNATIGKTLSLYKINALLRQRTRWDREEGEKEFSRKYTNFQSKNSSTMSEGFNNAVFARNEFRGKKFTSLKKFKQAKESLLSPNSDDNAVNFARQLISFNGEFSPVLSVLQERYFLKIYSKDSEIPDFYLSLDKVKYKSLLSKGKSVEEWIVEIEIIDDLKANNPKEQQKKIRIFNQFVSLIQNRFGLAAAKKDKYASGVEKTILDH